MSSNTNPSLQRKTAARIAAVQCIYTRLLSDISPDPLRQINALKKRLANNTDEQKLTLGIALEPNYTLLGDIVQGTVEYGVEINFRLDSVLSNEWKRERMSPNLIAILQAAIFELFFHREEPNAPVVISEYSRITERFFSDAEVNFVHGALKNLSQKYHG